MSYIKSPEEINKIIEGGKIIGEILEKISKMVKPGISAWEIDVEAERLIVEAGGRPAFKNYRGHRSEPPFPSTICASVNEEVVHGIPSTNKILKDGDVVSVDCGTVLNGFVGDSAYTFTVGEINNEVKNLLRVTQECLSLGVEKAKYGNRIGDISFAVQDHAEKNGYGVVRELVGHGVGKKLHEDPEVPNFGRRGTGPKLLPGLVIAIEPMINMGKKNVSEAADGWTIYTQDFKPSAHFEHTVVVLKDRTEILTTFKFIEEKLKLVSVD